jgi:nucleotide-binding universal stress UspA family protein
MPHHTLHRITHPTDFTRDSENAFHHALRLAVAADAKLDVLHVDEHPHAVQWDRFPDVRETLKQWQMLPTNGDGAMAVQKLSEYGKDPVQPILDHLDEFPADLIVLATHRRKGLDRWLHKEIAQKVARSRSTSTLFIPHGVDGFVSASTGGVSLRRILIPVDWKPEPQPAVDAAVAIGELLGCEDLEIEVLFVGEHELDMPPVELPQRERWTWQRLIRPGAVVDTILAAAKAQDADLIVMATEGRDGFLDALRGSTTEQILRHTRCPVLAFPGLGY